MKRNGVYTLTSEDLSKLSLSGVYCIASKLSKKKYIGSTTVIGGFIKRWCEHYSSLQRKTHYNDYLQNHVNKYGINDLEFTILEIVPDLTKCRQREKYWIDYFGFDNCFNISKETDMSVSGETHCNYKYIDVENVVDLYNQGKSIKELSSFFNVSESKIKKTLYNYGVESLRKNRELPLTEIFYRNVLGKESYCSLAKEFGIDKTTLRMELKRNGFKTHHECILAYLDRAKEYFKQHRGLRVFCRKLPFDAITFLKIIKNE
jgi:hypothetical protein